MARKRVTLEQWLVEALSDNDKGGPCTTISLQYVKAGSGSLEEIHSKSIKPPVEAKSLADFFNNKATGYAQDLPGIQTFKLLAFYGGSDQAQATHPFTVIDGEINAGGESAFARHEPTEKGLQAQLMKHNEVVTSLLTQICQTLAVQSVQREQQMRAEVAEANVIVRDVIMNMTDKQNAHQLAMLAYQRETVERQAIMKALPMGINALAGREVVPQGYADTEILDAMALKVQPQHLQVLQQMGILTPDQVTLLAARFTKTLEEKAKEAALIRTIPGETGVKPPEQSNGSPEANGQ
jgi:hypothetical protein